MTTMSKIRTRHGRWTVYTYDDGTFEHARHDDRTVRVRFTEDEFAAADRGAHNDWRARMSP